tara:strand:- start:1860 stop:2603 length:744 start_codon:yes stop_codon:yes gene_type:complete
MERDLRDKIVLVTGAGKGIGKSTVVELLNRGAYVYAATKSKNDLKSLENKNLKKFYGDVRNINFVEKIFKYAKKNNKVINSLINNAGRRQREKFEKINKKKLDYILDSNVKSVFQIMQIFYKYTKNLKNYKSIVNIGSIVGIKGFDSLSGYGMTKTALIGLTNCFFIEKSSEKYKCNIINPGFIKTSYYKKFKEKKRNLYNWTLKKTPMKKWGDSSDVAELICFLVSDTSNYINGQTINLDGGWTTG